MLIYLAKKSLGKKKTIMNKLKLIISLIHISIFLLGGIGIGKAQPTQRSWILVPPTSIDTRVKNEADYAQSFINKNNTGVRFHSRCLIEDIGFDEIENSLTYRPGSLPHSALPWLQFTPTKIATEPHNSITVKATVSDKRLGDLLIFDKWKAENISSNILTKRVSSIENKFCGLVLFTNILGAVYSINSKSGQNSPLTTTSKLNLNLGNRKIADEQLHGAFAILKSSEKPIKRKNIEENIYLPTQTNKLSGEPIAINRPDFTLNYSRVRLETFSRSFQPHFTIN